jgi:ribosomal protein S18 acetylase RimI-like enzyme
MTFDEYDAFVDHVIAGYARQQVDSGLLPEAEATAYAREQHQQVLPDGIATPNHHLWTVRDATDAEVGLLWLHVHPRPGGDVEAFVYDVELLPDARGKGLGRATMLAAEDAARALGADLVRLNVFGHNEPAERLYTRLGYREAMLALARRLDGPVPAGPGGAVLAEMAADDVAGFVTRLEDEVAGGLARSLLMSASQARDEARTAVDRLLPDGRTTPGAVLLVARDGDDRVAEVWLQVADRSDGPHAQARLLLDDPTRLADVVAATLSTSRDRGIAGLDVTVRGDDAAARAVYESAGFSLTAMQMLKPLHT